MGHQANGQGSIAQLQPGRWRLTLMVGYRWVDGRKQREQVTFYGPTEQNVLDQRDAYKGQRRAGFQPTIAKNRQLWHELLDRWLDAIAPSDPPLEDDLDPRTWASYRGVVDRHIKPVIGLIRVRELQPAELEAAYKRLRSLGYRRTAQLAHVVMSRAEKWGLRNGDCLRRVTELVNTPDYQAPRRQPPRADALGAILGLLGARVATAHGRGAVDAVAELIRLEVRSGCRPSELCGLTWPRVTWDDGGIEVAATRADGRERTPRKPKTDRSCRFVALSEEAMASLRLHRQAQLAQRLRAPSWTENDLVFATRTGGPLYVRNVRRVFRKMLAALGLELDDARLYGLRHAHITELLDQNLPLEDVSRRAGHSTAYFTDLVYNHPRREKDRALADALELRLTRRPAARGG